MRGWALARSDVGQARKRGVSQGHSALHVFNSATHCCGLGPWLLAASAMQRSRSSWQSAMQGEMGTGFEAGVDGAKKLTDNSDATAPIGLKIVVPGEPPHKMPSSVPVVGGVPATVSIGEPLSPPAASSAAAVWQSTVNIEPA